MTQTREELLAHLKRIARQGGISASYDSEHMASIGRKGGIAVSQDREHMREIGRKGGKAKRFNYDDR